MTPHIRQAAWLLLVAVLLLAGCTSKRTPLRISPTTPATPAAASAVPPRSPTTFYVSQLGSGTSCTRSAPCAPDVALRLLAPGDTLSIQGTLTTALVIDKSGTAGNWITITGGRIDAPTDAHDALLVNGSYLEIRGLEVTGGDSFGVRVKGHDVRLVDLDVHDTVWENRVGDSCIDGTDGGWGRAVTFAPSAWHVELSGGKVYDNCGEGIGFTMNGDAYVHDVEVYDNYSRNIYIANATGIRIEQVTSYYSDPRFYRGGKPGRCIGLGIEQGDFEIYGNMLKDTVIQNNNLYDCQGINLYQELRNQFPLNVLVQGNIFTNVPFPQVDLLGKGIVIKDNTVGGG